MSAAPTALPARSRLRNFAPLFWVLLLVAALIVAAFLSTPAALAPPYALDSVQPDGLRGLGLWLEAMGFRVEKSRRDQFLLPAAADLLLVYPGAQHYTSNDARELARWVQAGGTVVLVNLYSNSIERALGTGSSDQASLPPSRTTSQAQPLLPDAPAEWGIEEMWGPTLDLGSDSPGVSAVRNGEGGHTAIVMRHGEGWVWKLSSAHDLTNATLRNSAQAALVPALLRAVPARGLVLFDDYHFSGQMVGDAPAITTMQGWLYGTAPGRALLFILLVGALFWLMQGRRLGPALTPQSELRRREAAEYVRALASLKRRAHVRKEVAAHHSRRLRVALARTRALHNSTDAHEDDDAFMRRLRAESGWDDTEIQRAEQILRALRDPASEEALVKAVAEAHALLAERR